jgi:hypothetical protein
MVKALVFLLLALAGLADGLERRHNDHSGKKQHKRKQLDVIEDVELEAESRPHRRHRGHEVAVLDARLHDLAALLDQQLETAGTGEWSIAGALDAVNSAVSSVSAAAASAAQSIKDGAAAITEAAMSKIGDVVDGIKKNIKETLEQVWCSKPGAPECTPNSVMKKLPEWASSALKAAMDAIKNPQGAMTKVYNAIEKGVLDAFKFNMTKLLEVPYKMFEMAKELVKSSVFAVFNSGTVTEGISTAFKTVAMTVVTRGLGLLETVYAQLKQVLPNGIMGFSWSPKPLKLDTLKPVLTDPAFKLDLESDLSLERETSLSAVNDNFPTYLDEKNHLMLSASTDEMESVEADEERRSMLSGACLGISFGLDCSFGIPTPPAVNPFGFKIGFSVMLCAGPAGAGVQFTLSLGFLAGAQAGFGGFSLGGSIAVITQSACLEQGFEGPASCSTGPGLDLDVDTTDCKTIGFGFDPMTMAAAFMAGPFMGDYWTDIHFTQAVATGTNIKLFTVGIVPSGSVSVMNSELAEYIKAFALSYLLPMFQAIFVPLGAFVSGLVGGLEREISALSKAGSEMALDRSDAAIEDLEAVVQLAELRLEKAKMDRIYAEVQQNARAIRDLRVSGGFSD